MPADNPNLSAEVAKLTEAVRDLRDREVAEELARLREEVAALRAEKSGTQHHCNGCGCIHWHYWPGIWTGGTAGISPTWTVNTGAVGYTVTNMAAGGSGSLTVGSTTSTVNYS